MSASPDKTSFVICFRDVTDSLLNGEWKFSFSRTNRECTPSYLQTTCACSDIYPSQHILCERRAAKQLANNIFWELFFTLTHCLTRGCRKHIWYIVWFLNAVRLLDKYFQPKFLVIFPVASGKKLVHSMPTTLLSVWFIGITVIYFIE